MEPDDNLLNICPTDASRYLLSLIMKEQIWDLEKLNDRCSKSFLYRVMLKEALDDLIKCKLIAVVPSFRVSSQNKWEIYNKIILGVNNEE